MLPKRQSSNEAESGGREPANVSQSWAQTQFENSVVARRVTWMASLAAATLVLACGGATALPSPGSSVLDAGGAAPARPGDDPVNGSDDGETPSQGKPTAGAVAAPAQGGIQMLFD